MADDPVVKPVATIKPKKDEEEIIELADQTDESDPAGEGGGQVMDIDQERRLTGTDSDDDQNTRRKPLNTAQDLDLNEKEEWEE